MTAEDWGKQQVSGYSEAAEQFRQTLFHVNWQFQLAVKRSENACST